MHHATRAGALAALALSCLVCVRPAAAGPSDYVVTPDVEEGEREIDFKAGTRRLPDGTRESAWSIGLGYGATSWWFTELYAKWHHEPGDRSTFDAWEWENKFQLTETGRYPVDVGLLLEIERPKDRSEGYEYRWGPLLQSEFGRWQANLNLLIEKHIRAAEPQKAELGYQWQMKYRWKPSIEAGLQGFGSVGPWSDWAPSKEQSHIAGPALFGRVRVGEHQAIKYNAGLLFGLNDASPRHTLRVQAEYEF
jgi:hypothetical protein